MSLPQVGRGALTVMLLSWLHICFSWSASLVVYFPWHIELVVEDLCWWETEMLNVHMAQEVIAKCLRTVGALYWTSLGGPLVGGFALAISRHAVESF